METDRQAFLDRRRKGIGASDVATIFGVNQYKTPYELWLDKTGRIEHDTGNDATALGTTLEPSILDYAERDLGPLDRNVVVPHEGSVIVSTLDGCREGKPVEAKTAGLTNAFADLSAWGEPETDEVPSSYLCQVQTQLLCTKEELAYLYALIAGRGIVKYVIPVSRTLTTAIEERCGEWWDKHVIADTPPPLDPVPSPDVFKRVKRAPDKTIVMSNEASAWIEARDRVSEEIKQKEKELDHLQSRILAELGDAEAGELPDGRTLTYFAQTRKGYTVEPVTFRVMRVKKGKK